MAAAHFSSGRKEMEAAERWLLVMVMVLLPLCYGDGLSVSRQKLEVQKLLKSLNKPPIKSIKSRDGDIIDCVNISHQPAFDHPLLKNHTIQMRPNYYPEGLFGENNVTIPKSTGGISKPITQLWHLSGSCPEGTIPIRRTKSEDLLRASSVKSYGKKKHEAISKSASSADPDLIVNLSEHQYGIATVQGGKYYGTKATMTVWGPRVQQSNEFSLSQLWILSGSYASSDLNSIEAGWQVYPELYGDSNPRLFIYWTRDAYQSTGCYNLRCSGFIQTNKNIAIGGSISQLVSAYQGPQHEISILVYKDPKGGNWWMQYGNDWLGYWPASLFTSLADSASVIEWGGEVVNKASGGQHTTTEMGSGHFPGEGYGKASYFRNLQVVDGSNSLSAPNAINTQASQPNCYDVQAGKNGDWGNYFFYGGPGRNPNCP